MGKYVHEQVRTDALNWLLGENKTKTKTRHIIFNELETGKYLLKKQTNTVLSKIILSVRSGTLDFKKWNALK